MKPELLLLPPDAGLSLLHQNGIIFRQYRFNEDEYYFSLHPEPFPLGNSIDYTGRYLVVLFSIKGIEIFYIIPTLDGRYTIASEEDETDYSALDADSAIKEIEGIHIAPETTDTEEDEESYGDNFEDDDKPFVDYLTFDSREILLPLLIDAIHEAKPS